MYIIYKYTSPTEKIYIGKTLFSRESKRKTEHKKRAKAGEDTAFYRSIRKYGFDNHSYEVLCFVETENEAYECEKAYIIKYNSFKNGLNSSEGGIGVGSGENHPMYGVTGTMHPNYGKYASNSTFYKGDVIAVHKITGERLILKGKKDIQEKGFHYCDVIKCLKGVHKTHKGYAFTRCDITPFQIASRSGTEQMSTEVTTWKGADGSL